MKSLVTVALLALYLAKPSASAATSEYFDRICADVNGTQYHFSQEKIAAIYQKISDGLGDTPAKDIDYNSSTFAEKLFARGKFNADDKIIFNRLNEIGALDNYRPTHLSQK